MKQLTFVLFLTAILTASVWTAFADEAAQEVEVDLQAVEATVVEPAPEAIDLTALDFPLTPDFAVAEGGTCTPCSNHGQCAIACGGFGACFRDFGGLCGGAPTDKFCFC